MEIISKKYILKYIPFLVQHRCPYISKFNVIGSFCQTFEFSVQFFIVSPDIPPGDAGFW